MFKQSIAVLVLLLVLSVGNTSAQTSEFTYQGKLNDGALAANGNYDLQFELHNSLSGTTPLDSATLIGVIVANGVFTVNLSFVATLFDGTDRFLKISVRPAGSPNPFTPLAPYQKITSAPYAIKSLRAETATTATTADLAGNAERLGGITADQFVQTNDTRLSDARTPLAGSANYVQNTTSPQTSSNFNISGTGTANVFNAAIQYNIGGNRAFVVQGGGSQNVFAGLNAGTSNTTGFGNSFVGNFAGNINSTGANNSFFGTDAGRNSGGNGNSFFGRSSGFATTVGFDNAFFGLDSGRFNQTGSQNAFFGKESGFNNIADGNSFFGYRSGYGNTDGVENSFFGFGAGQTNSTGRFNSFFGYSAGFANTGTSNSFFGTNAGISNGAGGNNAFFGTIAGQSNTTGGNNTFYGAGAANTIGANNTAVGFLANFGTNNLNFATAIGSGSSVSMSNTIALGRSDGSDSVVIYGNLAVNGVFDLPAGDASYIQNRTSPQSSSNFNISGNGIVGGSLSGNLLNSATQYNIGGNRALSANGTSIFVGNANVSAGGSNIVIGNNAGSSSLTGASNTIIGANSGTSLSGNGTFNVIVGSNSDVSANTLNSVVIGNGVSTNASNHVEIGTSAQTVRIPGSTGVGSLSISTFGSGSTALCRNSSGDVSNCSSSLRYKTKVRNFFGGLEMLRRFRPVTFNWKADRNRDIGFIAEEVNEIEPLLTTRNADGEIEGVKYAQITTILVNSVNEQQAQIESLQKTINFHQAQIAALRKLVCAQNQAAEICKEQ